MKNMNKKNIYHYSFFLVFLILNVYLCFNLLIKSPNSFYLQNDNEITSLQTRNENNANSLWNKTMSEHIGALAISSDSNYIVIGCDNNKTYLFNKLTSIPIWNYTGNGTVTSVAISENGSYIVAGTSGGNIYFFNNSNSTPLWNYSLSESIISVDISSDGTYVLAISSLDVYLFNKSISIIKSPMWNYTNLENKYDAVISSDGKYIAVAGGYLWLFEISNPVPIREYSAGGLYYISVSISSNGRYIAAVAENAIYLYDRFSSNALWYYSILEMKDIEISSDGNYIAAGGIDSKLYFFKKSSATPIWSTSTGYIINSIAISNDGNYILCGNSGDFLYLFHKSNSFPIWELNTTNSVNSVAMSSDGKFFIASNNNFDLLFFQNLYQPSLNNFWNLILLISFICVGIIIGFLILWIYIRRKNIKPRIFLAYAKEDYNKFQISKIAEALNKYPEIEEVFYKKTSIDEDILKSLNEKLDNSRALLLFCSENTIDSLDVEMKWMLALKKKKKIIPVPDDWENVPAILSMKLGTKYISDDIDSTIENIYQVILKQLKIKPKEKEENSKN